MSNLPIHHLIAEIEHLTGTDDPTAIAQRLGYTSTGSIHRALARAGRLDVWQRLTSTRTGHIHTGHVPKGAAA